jgi:subtilisin family serine protease
MKKQFMFLGLSAILVLCLSNRVDNNHLKSVADIVTSHEWGPTDNGQAIPGKYIVVLKESAVDIGALGQAQTLKAKKGIVAEKARGLMKGKGISSAKLERAYGKAILGFSAGLTKPEMEELAKDPNVDFIEPDRIITLAPPPGRGNGGGDDGGGGQSIPYGITDVGGALDAIGKTAWIIDTGIDLDHPDLNVSTTHGFSAFTKGKNAGFDDGNGHGTHCAGTVAAIDNGIGVVGVAAGATVVPVKVLDARGSGSYSGVIDGVDYVAANAAIGDAVNMSLGGPVSEALDLAVRNAAESGLLFALAAGNESDDANNHSPARANHANIWTVSAKDADNNFASFSNFGNPPVDVCAPGVGINSTWKGGGYNTISGTSMAAPHVCGLLLFGTSVTGSTTVNNDPDGSPDPNAHR